MDDKDHRDWMTATALMGKVLARQDEPWRLVYALVDDVYSEYWRALRDSSDAERAVPWVEYVKALGAAADQKLLIWVSTQRRNGASWAQIGAALAISKQAAQQRFGVKNS